MADDVDLWEHIRYDDTVPMSVDEEELAAALAAGGSGAVDDFLADMVAVAEAEKAAAGATGAADSPAAALAGLGSPGRRGRLRRLLVRRRRPMPSNRVLDGGARAPVQHPVRPEAAEREVVEPVQLLVEPEVDDEVDDEVEVPEDPVLAELEAEIAAEEAGDDVDDEPELVPVVDLDSRRTPEPVEGADAAPDPDPDPDSEPEGAVVSRESVVLTDRMRARRIAVRRDEGRRRLRRLAWGLGGVTLLVNGAAIAHTPFVDVDRIEVTTGPNTPAAAVQAASGIDRGDAMLTLDESGAEAKIERLSWVADADVQREWPSTVRIVVHERAPAAILQSPLPGQPLGLADAEGRVLQIGGPVPFGLVTVTGVPAVMHQGEPVPPTVRDALRLAVTAPVVVPGAVTAVSLDLEATLTSGGVVRFGSLRDLDEKLVALATVLARVDTSCLGVLDLKVPGSPTVSRRPC